MVNRRDGRVRAMPFCFRSQGKDDDAGNQPTECGHHGEEPGPAHRPDHWLSLAHRPRWQIARDTAKEEFGGQSNRPCEKNRPKPGHQPDDSPEHQPFREVPRAFEPATFR